ncbi:MAG: hypothetical protein KBT48_07300 [Firmicutes bacterium]|nr:hypothetical protein [Bacillota bacterium]
MKKNFTLYNIFFKWGGALCFLALLFYLSYNIRLDSSAFSCPDEYMRYPVAQFIYNHGYLPRGDEKEIMNEIWGFSYGYTPYLPSIFSALFMKLTSFYSTSEKDLLTAARFISVLSGFGTWIFVSKIGNQIFEKKRYAILLTCLCCFLPQFIYICSYLNNDAFSVFCSSIIVYAWIRNIKENWSTRYCVLLGIGIGLLALTYYNAFGFILCSMILYTMDNIRKRNSVADFFKKALLIFCVAFAIGGWFYIRNFLIHNGDFLGMKTMYASGEKFAQDIYKPSMRQTPKNLGISVLGMLKNGQWIKNTIMSFVGQFGYLTVYIPRYIMWYMVLVFTIGSVFFLLYPIVRKKLAVHNIDWIQIVNLILCIFIPVGLSIYYSWATDYQAQGRYIMSAIIPLSMCCTLGIYSFVHFIENRVIKFMMVFLMTIVYVAFSGIAIYFYMIPFCF